MSGIRKIPKDVILEIARRAFYGEAPTSVIQESGYSCGNITLWKRDKNSLYMKALEILSEREGRPIPDHLATFNKRSWSRLPREKKITAEEILLTKRRSDRYEVPKEVLDKIVSLALKGLTRDEIAERVNLPNTTVRNWFLTPETTISGQYISAKMAEERIRIESENRKRLGKP